MNILFAILSVAVLSFAHLSSRDGLTSGSVTDVYFDEKGTVWIGTGGGLNSYDGYSFRNHLFGLEPGETPHSNSVLRLSGDGNGTLYVAAVGEIYSIDCTNMTTRTISQDHTRAMEWWNGALYVGVGGMVKKYTPGAELPGNAANFGNDCIISAMVIRPDGILFAGTEQGVVYAVDMGKGVIQKTWTLGSMVERMFIDSEGDLWAGTFSDGLFRIGGDGPVVQYLHDPDNSGSIASNFVRTICEDSMGGLWVGTFDGLDFLDRKSGVFSHHRHYRFSDTSLSDDSVWIIRKDPQGTLWAGTFFGGLNLFNPEFMNYTRFSVSPMEGEGLSSDNISSVSEYGDGRILIATEGGGLNIMDPDTGRTVWYTRGGAAGRSLAERNAKDILPDPKRGCIWVGTHLGGLSRIDMRTGRSVPFRSVGSPGDDPLTDDILCLADKGDSIISGTKTGIYVISKKDARYRAISASDTAPSEETGIKMVDIDANGDLWYVDAGLFRYSFRTGRKESFFPGYRVSGFRVCSDGSICVCTRSRGVFFLDPETGDSEFVNLDPYLPSPVRVYRVTESPFTGNFLLGCSNGLAVLDRASGRASYYGKGNGFPLSGFSKAMKVSSDGTIYAGGAHGLVSFREENLSTPTKPFIVNFSRLFINNEEALPGGVLERSLPYCSSITLPAGTSSFAVQFLNSNNIPGIGRGGMEYKVDGYSKEWTELWHDSNTVSFPKLSSGKYVLRLRPVDFGPETCPEVSLRIRVLAPWYATWPAFVAYLLLLLIMLALAIRKSLDMIRRKIEIRLSSRKEEAEERFRIFEKATHIIYNNLENSEFGVNDLATEMALSRSGLFDKIKKATGLTPGGLIMDIRMKEAASLIVSKPGMSVAEVADRVGFSSTHYFSKCFKDRFGEAPLAYRRRLSPKKK